MNDSPEINRIAHVENVAVGDRSSRMSSAIFASVCFIPIFSTVLFGAVDNITWVFLTVFCAMIALLWVAEAWKGTGLLINTDAIQLPMIALLLIGIVQLLPLGSG